MAERRRRLALERRENDGFWEKTRTLKMFKVSQDTIQAQIPNILHEAEKYYMDSEHPLFMLIQTKPLSRDRSGNFYYSGRPSYWTYNFDFENFDSLVHAINHPFETYYYTTEEIAYSDLLYKIDKNVDQYDRKANKDPVHEVTAIGFFTTPEQRYLLMEDDAEYLEDIANNYNEIGVYNPETGIHDFHSRSQRKGLFMPFAFNYDKLDEDTPLAHRWKEIFKEKEDVLLKLQIPWGHEEELKEDENDGCIKGFHFAAPCLLAAVADQIDKQTYDILKEEKIIFGVGTKTTDFKNIMFEHGYYVDIYRIQPVADSDRFKINHDIYKPKKNSEDLKPVKIMYWEGHWMYYDQEMLRLLEQSKREGFLKRLNAYEYAMLYKNYSFDKMLKFDEKLFLSEHKNDYEFSEAYFDKMEFKEKHNPKYVYFADFEASTNEVFHRPYLVCINGIELKKEGDTITYAPIPHSNRYFWGKHCATTMLQHIVLMHGVDSYEKARRPNVRIYFYNLRYDFTFIQQHLTKVKRIIKGNKLYSVSGFFKHRTCDKMAMIDFWDALPIFKTSLKKTAQDYLTSEQKQSIKKEVYPYELYTYQFFKKYPDGYCPIEEFKAGFIKQEDLREINQEVWDSLVKGDKINYIEYAVFYCRQDVNCLKNIMINFAKLLEGHGLEGINGTLPFSISLWKYRTASSIGYDYFKKAIMLKKQGSEYVPMHDWCIPKSTLRYLIQQTIRGGRVMTRDNEKWYYKATDETNYLQDYDGVSLYPSAMSLLWLTEGAPKLIKGDFTEEAIKLCFAPPDGDDNVSKYLYKDGCVHVTYINTRKDRHFPLLCVKDPKTKLNNYKNFHEETVNTWVNVIDLFNLMDFQDAEIRWDAAIVWEGERYFEIREGIQKLFEFRAQNKKHPIQMVIKLILNSIFGKSILKPQDKEKILVPKKGFRLDHERGGYIEVNTWNEYFNANAYRIHRFEDLNGNFMDVELYKRDTSSSFNMFGSNVLAMARRIIGRVMALGEDIEEQHPELSPGLFYTDTDSMHIRQDLLFLLEEEYKNKYGAEIKGSKLTQFHIDFDPPQTFMKDEVVKGACESYFVMKKVYADRLIGDKGSIDYHMRLKGIPTDLVKYENYKQIYDGEAVTFNMLDGHTSFFYKNGEVGSRFSMTREIMTREAREKRKHPEEFDENKKSKLVF